MDGTISLTARINLLMELADGGNQLVLGRSLTGEKGCPRKNNSRRLSEIKAPRAEWETSHPVLVSGGTSFQ
jgi:hypothetical protein